MSDDNAPPSIPAQNIPAMPGQELKWPKVLGIITIIFGVLGILGAFGSFFSGQILKLQFKLMSLAQEVPQSQFDEFHAVIAKWNWVPFLSGTISLVANALLLFAGISCLKKKRSCKPLAIAFAIAMFGLVGFSAWTLFGTNMTDEQTRAMVAVQDVDEIALKTQIMLGKIFGVIGSVMYLALPIFLFIWFMRTKISNDLLSDEFS